MPTNWTVDNDRMLLLKILETHQIKVDALKIHNAWPEDGNGERPTARAVTERLVKIRNMAKNSGAAHFAVSSTQSNGSGSGSTPKQVKPPRRTSSNGTPSKGTPKGGVASGRVTKQQQTPRKRSRPTAMIDSNENEVEAETGATHDGGNDDAAHKQGEGMDEDGSDMDEVGYASDSKHGFMKEEIDAEMEGPDFWDCP
ncbi:hypothetical protein MMC25_000827 [Agyrium rufum]|nr:hypothetical protein [Agyrium rufum]